MSSYFYSENDEQLGPVTIEDLKTKNINRNTLVWKEGMENWQKASEVKELASLFASVPPPLPKKKKEASTPPPISESKANLSAKRFYYVDSKNEKHGPYTIEEMSKIGLPPANLIQEENTDNWQAISSVSEFARFYPNSENSKHPKPNKAPSAKTMFMRFIAILLGLFGVFLLIGLLVDFDVVSLIIGGISLALSFWVFKKNRVTYKMTEAEKGSHMGMMLGHFMNMGDD